MIPKTALHRAYSLDEFSRNLIGLQSDMVRNAEAHQQAALAETMPAEALAANIASCVSAYQQRVAWVSDFIADTDKLATLTIALDALGWTLNDITDVTDALSAAVVTLASANVTTYAEAADACAALLSSVAAPDAPIALWDR